MTARVGIVGCGIIAKVYVEGSAAFDSFDVVACSDLDVESADAFADVHGLQAASVDELIADPSIDVVLNLTPPAAHAEVMRASLRCRSSGPPHRVCAGHVPRQCVRDGA
jgi:predicted dehydrogenase